MFTWPFSKTYQVRCPDGTIRTVYKKVDDAIPLSIPGWQGKVGADVKAVESMSGKLNAEYATKVQGLLYNLDDLNNSLMLKFRAAYLVYIGNPCGSSDYLQRQVEKISDEQDRLQNLKLRIEGLIALAEMNSTRPDVVMPVYLEIVHQLGGSTVPAAAAIEIAETREIAKDWVEGEYGS